MWNQIKKDVLNCPANLERELRRRLGRESRKQKFEAHTAPHKPDIIGGSGAAAPRAWVALACGRPRGRLDPCQHALGHLWGTKTRPSSIPYVNGR
jgi:hypothetical protein